MLLLILLLVIFVDSTIFSFFYWILVIFGKKNPDLVFFKFISWVFSSYISSLKIFLDCCFKIKLFGYILRLFIICIFYSLESSNIESVYLFKLEFIFAKKSQLSCFFYFDMDNKLIYSCIKDIYYYNCSKKTLSSSFYNIFEGLIVIIYKNKN